jgi:molybdenum cofactor cytidylyltransferase
MRSVVSSLGDLKALSETALHGVIVVTGQDKSEDRVTGPNDEILQALSDFARKNSLPLLIEADGARLRALKAPADHEPAIPNFVDAVVVTAGLSGLSKQLTDEWVHRPERFAELNGLQMGDEITQQALSSVLLHEEGGLKNIPQGARRIALLNQADTPELEAVALGMSRKLLSFYYAVWVGSLQNSPDLSAVHEPIAGILLAAGESKRLGQPKALMDWKGKSFVRQIAETALVAKLDPVIVVTGSDAESIEAELRGLAVTIVRNKDWQRAQSSSVKAGIAALPSGVGAALFLVVDQPQLSVPLIEQLIAQHAHSLAPIVAPLVDDHRTNPVLFDRSTFPDFSVLEGDVGGRAIFSRHRVHWVPWLDSSLAIDVDTPEDYSRLINTIGPSQ